MNKEITKYELLGLVKDGQAPKKIKLREEIYNYYQDEENFVNYESEKDGDWLFNQYLCNLNDKVEIIEN